MLWLKCMRSTKSSLRQPIHPLFLHTSSQVHRCTGVWWYVTDVATLHHSRYRSPLARLERSTSDLPSATTTNNANEKLALRWRGWPATYLRSEQFPHRYRSLTLIESVTAHIHVTQSHRDHTIIYNNTMKSFLAPTGTAGGRYCI